MRNMLTNALLLGCGLAFLAHFSLIAKCGSIQIREPNPLFLALEIALFIAITAFAFGNLIACLKEVAHDVTMRKHRWHNMVVKNKERSFTK
jgi:hypothetical protein